MPFLLQRLRTGAVAQESAPASAGALTLVRVRTMPVGYLLSFFGAFFMLSGLLSFMPAVF